jgi:hypothetical protein
VAVVSSVAQTLCHLTSSASEVSTDSTFIAWDHPLELWAVAHCDACVSSLVLKIGKVLSRVCNLCLTDCFVSLCVS